MSELASEKLSFSYSNRLILDRISVEMRAGEVVVLLGANGAGKTTLLQSLCRQLRPESGSVRVSGQEIAHLSRRALSQSIAFMPQHENRQAELSVYDVVSLGRTPHCGWWKPLSKSDRGAIEDALVTTGLSELRERLITQISGGEWRRMILARALAQDAPILLLDEPTAGLDLKYQFDILNRVRQMARDRKWVVVITLHDLNHAAMFGDRLALLADGKLIAVGTAREVLTPPLIERSFGISATVIDHPIHGSPLVVPLFQVESARNPGGR
jgi:iron complex transport system ATP-binding protein